MVVPRVEHPLVEPRQGALFGTCSSSLTCFALTSGVSGDELSSWMLSVKLRFLFDLRPVPRFDIGRLSREIGYGWMTQWGATDWDVSGVLGLYHPCNLEVATAGIKDFVSEVLKTHAAHSRQVCGPVFLLFDDHACLEAASREVPWSLETVPKGGWEVRNFFPSPRSVE